MTPLDIGPVRARSRVQRCGGACGFGWPLRRRRASSSSLPSSRSRPSPAGGSGDLWPHLVANVLPVGAAQHGAPSRSASASSSSRSAPAAAWLVTAYDFPGRRILDWALLLPLAVPTYIVAYAYLDILHPIGPVQTALRAILGIATPRDLRLPDIRSIAGAILLLGFVLYPYVYLVDAGAVPDAGGRPASMRRARSAPAGAGSSSGSRCRSPGRRSRSAPASR